MIIIEKLYKIKKYIVKSFRYFYRNYFTVDGMYTSLLPDRIYLKKLYKKKMGKPLNLKNPCTFNEKLNWLKLYNRKPEYTMMADKYRVREFVKEKIGEEYLVPLLGVYDNVEDIDFDVLPNEFVLKCNHDSEVVICRDKKNNDFTCKKHRLNDLDDVKKFLDRRLKINFYKASREWPYKNIPRKIICEEFLKNHDGSQLIEYNVFCFNGNPCFFKVGTQKVDGTLIKAFYDLKWKYLDISTGIMAGDIFDKPKLYEEMLNISKKFSENIPHLRVDFLVCNGKLFSGELTFFSAGGFWQLEPSKWDYTFGEYIELPKKKHRAR